MSIKHEIRKDGNRKFKVVKLTPIKAIRYHCIECVGFQKAMIPGCLSKHCPLYPFRLGRNPSSG